MLDHRSDTDAALIDILEDSAIAWPNPAMWRRGSFNPTMPFHQESSSNEPEMHLHSPRRHSDYASSSSNLSGSTSLPLGAPFAPESSFIDPMPSANYIAEHGLPGLASGFRTDMPGQSGSDTAPYLDWAHSLGHVGYPNETDPRKQVFDPVTGLDSTRHEKQPHSNVGPSALEVNSSNRSQPLADMQGPSTTLSMYDDPEGCSDALKVPTNTPTTNTDPSSFNVNDLEVGMDNVEASGGRDIL